MLDTVGFWARSMNFVIWWIDWLIGIIIVIRAGTCSHGHLHGAGDPLLQVQTTEDEGTSGTVLVKSQHSEGRSKMIPYETTQILKCTLYCAWYLWYQMFRRTIRSNSPLGFSLVYLAANFLELMLYRHWSTDEFLWCKWFKSTIEYLSRSCVPLTAVPGRSQLRSADDRQLVLPRIITVTLGPRTFY